MKGLAIIPKLALLILSKNQTKKNFEAGYVYYLEDLRTKALGSSTNFFFITTCYS
jgi:hypothetical protein